MKRTTWRLCLLPFFLIFLFITNVLTSDQKPESPFIMEWRPPPSGEKMGIIDGLDRKTLETLAEAGVIQYFQPRELKGRWDVVIGMMIHAPAQTVWDVVSDHEAACKYMDDTFDSCETLSHEGDKVVMHYLLHTSVVKFSFKLDIIDEITENPPHGWRLDTTEGSLKGRELEIILIPAGDARTMTFLRYYGSIRSINKFMKMMLARVPDLESPVYASAATYHLRSYKIEAEKRSGYTPPDGTRQIDHSRLDPKTLTRLSRWYGGVVRETADGKAMDATAFESVDAPQKAAWEVLTDFEHYNEFFPGSNTIVEKREGNEILLRQSTTPFNVFFFKLGFDLHTRYVLEEPERMYWRAIDGIYQDSTGEFVLLPYGDGGKKTFIFGTTGVVTDKDKSLGMRIVKSGAFPFESALNMFLSRDMLNKYKLEIERRRSPGTP